jgi:hypothetical protein
VAFALDACALKDAYGRDRPVAERSTSVQQTYPSLPSRHDPSVQGQEIDQEGSDLSSEPAWVQNQVRSMLYSSLWLDPAEPSYLFKQSWWFARDALADAYFPDAGVD